MIKVNYNKFQLFILSLCMVSCNEPNNTASNQNVFAIDIQNGYHEYKNTLNKTCLEGEFDRDNLRGEWRAYNCSGGLSIIINFESNESFTASYYKGGTSEKLFTYVVKKSKIVDVLCPNYDGSEDYSCLSKSDTTDSIESLGLSRICECEEEVKLGVTLQSSDKQ
jgi:hypothetical protein